MSTLTPAQRDALASNRRDYLAEYEAFLGDTGIPADAVQLGIGQQLRRIADQMERPDPDAAMRAYLAREGRAPRDFGAPGGVW